MLRKLVTVAVSLIAVTVHGQEDIDGDGISSAGDYAITEKCLSKTQSLGEPVDGVSDTFDQTSEIIKLLKADEYPAAYEVC